MVKRWTKKTVFTRLVLWPIAALVSVVLLLLGIFVGPPCISTGFAYGLWYADCPASMRLEAEVSGSQLARGHEGRIVVAPRAVSLQGEGHQAWRVAANFRRGSTVTMALEDGEGKTVDGVDFGQPRADGLDWVFGVTLPDVPDGDYVLRASVKTRFDEVEVRAPLGLYAHAMSHVLVDRPLVRPGGEIAVRSVTLRASDRTPLGGRSGTWTLLDPSGDVVWEERGTTSAHGVAHTSFPLDRLATTGPWMVRWSSGATQASSTFEVARFELPPAEVSLSSDKTWYTRGEPLTVRGTLLSNAGVPLRDVRVTGSARTASGRWPVPLAWEGPLQATTDSQGRFAFPLGEVPLDLMERTSVAFRVSATTSSGAAVSGQLSLVLSVDPLAVDAVTEFGDGLIGGLNNRAYVRVTDPAGKVLAGSEITVRNPWDTTDEGRVFTTDEDGVAAVQIDPGDPVTVEVPAPPVRQRPYVRRRPRMVSVQQLTGGVASSRTTAVVARAVDRVDDCSFLLDGSDTITTTTVRVEPSGRVQTMAGQGLVEACVADKLTGLRFPSGGPHTLVVRWELYEPRAASLREDTTVSGGVPGPVQKLIEELRLAARPCLRGWSFDRGQRSLGSWHWSAAAGERVLRGAWQTSGGSAAERRCLERVWAGRRLDQPVEETLLGVTSWTVRPPSIGGARSQGPTTKTGYELVVETEDGRRGNVVLSAGAVPALRIRLEPTLVKPGEQVTATLLRGPTFQGALPKRLELQRGATVVDRAQVDPKLRTATFTVPEDARGIHQVSWGGSRGLIFVRDEARLSLQIDSDKDRYRPGEVANLAVKTSASDQGVAAVVGLVGVDAALGQLKPLPGVDDLGTAFVRATSSDPAFGLFGPAALELGQVRGDQAARATLLRVGTIPQDAAGEQRVSLYGAVDFDDGVAMTDAFYVVFGVLLDRVDVWVREADKAEVMTPDRMVKMWGDALAEAAKRGLPHRDGFGRALELDVLPPDLLEELDPLRVVSDGTRLPEDLVGWTQYVRGGMR